MCSKSTSQGCKIVLWRRKRRSRKSYKRKSRDERSSDGSCLCVLGTYDDDDDDDCKKSMVISYTTKVTAALGATRNALGMHPLKNPTNPSERPMRRKVSIKP
mmetsp:Transcript_2763/g.7732  ORF Transcript_2763/g.7732 Transcript_2763/m.7732 type:complete len:102 (-) Transcript_2763:963-1268(-)